MIEMMKCLESSDVSTRSQRQSRNLPVSRLQVSRVTLQSTLLWPQLHSSLYAPCQRYSFFFFCSIKTPFKLQSVITCIF